MNPPPGRWPLRLVLALALAGCGGPPTLPPAEAPPTIAPGGDAALGARLFTDRGFGRTGLACSDCHPGVQSPLRPAPSLARWAAGEGRWAGAPRAPAETLAACLERFQARPAPSPTEAAHLRAAIGGVTASVAPTPTAPEALYRSACMHCHEAGPAGPVTGRRWLAGRLRRAVREAPSSARLMPRFDPAILPEPALRDLVEWLLGPAARSDTLSP